MYLRRALFGSRRGPDLGGEGEVRYWLFVEKVGEACAEVEAPEGIVAEEEEKAAVAAELERIGVRGDDGYSGDGLVGVGAEPAAVWPQAVDEADTADTVGGGVGDLPRAAAGPADAGELVQRGWRSRQVIHVVRGAEQRGPFRIVVIEVRRDGAENVADLDSSKGPVPAQVEQLRSVFPDTAQVAIPRPSTGGFGPNLPKAGLLQAPGADRMREVDPARTGNAGRPGSRIHLLQEPVHETWISSGLRGGD